MNPKRNIENLALIGFMGTGKSSVGRILADQSQFNFLDTDELIEARAQKPISRIFAEEGEAAFREYEQKIVDDLSALKKVVIATGGGLGANAAHLASLKKNSLVVCLWAAPEIILERVSNQTHRPLLQTPEPLAKIRQLLEQREPFYRLADVLVNTEQRTIREVVQQILHQFYLAKMDLR
ncbi:MAG: shikimate kinase [Limisphaerales bacterium]